MSAILTVKFNVGESPPPPSRPGMLYYLKRRDELYDPKDPVLNRYAPDGSFSQVGGEGVTRRIGVDEDVIDNLILSQPENRVLAKWAFTDLGTLYFHTIFDEAEHPIFADWGIVCISSTDTSLQVVNVLAVDSIPAPKCPEGRAEIDAIQYQPNGDYSKYMPGMPNTEGLWHRAWTDFKQGGYGPSHTFPDGRSYTFNMPLLSPATFPNASYDARMDAGPHGGFLVDRRILLGKV